MPLDPDLRLLRILYFPMQLTTPYLLTPIYYLFEKR